MKFPSGSQIHHFSEETPDESNGSAPTSHLSRFVDVSGLVSNGGLLVVSAAACVNVASRLASINGSSSEKMIASLSRGSLLDDVLHGGLNEVR